MTITEKFENFHSRGQIDVIELWIKNEAIYKYLFIYEDCFSRFIVFKAMRTNTIQETARKLLDVITMIGAPQVLQSTKGREFTKQVVQELRSIWTNFTILHGETLKLEGLNRDCRKTIDSWLSRNLTKSWIEGIKIVQALENTSFKHLDEKVPFDLLFTCSLKDPFSCNKSRAFLAEEDWLTFKSNNLIAKTYNTINDHISEGSNTIFKKRDISSNVNTDQEKTKLETDFHFVAVTNDSPIEHFSAENSFSSEEERTANNERLQIESKISETEFTKPDHFKSYLKSRTQTTYNCDHCSKSFRVSSLLNKHTKRCHNEKKPPNLEFPSNTEISKDESSLSKDENSKKKSKRYHNVEKTINSEDVPLRKEGEISPKKPAPTPRKKPSSNPSHECSHCHRKFLFPSVLKRHLRSHTNERPYACRLCGKTFKQLGHLSQHQVTHTDYRANRCPRCGLKLDSLEELKAHARSHGKGDDCHRLFECDACKKVFASKGVLERHVVTHTHERLYGCEECGKRFKQAGHVKSHMLVHTGEKRFACTICQKRFSLANSLKKHMYVHNGEKPYQCDVCGARFLEKRNLNGHIMTHTNERPHCCKICGKRYTLADTLRRHISAAHEVGRAYQCEICAKMFKQLAHLSVHKKVHNDERPFQCHLCAKAFKHNNVLKSHLAIHANLRPFECDLCRATFVRKTNLRIHVAAAHMNERPHVCRICGKRFKQVSHLNGHVAVHSNSMPYKCDFCDKRCNRLDNLKKHMRLHERDKDQRGEG